MVTVKCPSIWNAVDLKNSIWNSEVGERPSVQLPAGIERKMAL